MESVPIRDKNSVDKSLQIVNGEYQVRLNRDTERYKSVEQ